MFNTVKRCCQDKNVDLLEEQCFLHGTFQESICTWLIYLFPAVAFVVSPGKTSSCIIEVAKISEEEEESWKRIEKN